MGLALSILAGLLIWAGFPPVEFSPSPFIGAVILFSLLSRNRFKGRLIYSLIAGFSLFAPLLHWTSSYVGWIPWIALTLLQTSLFALISLVKLERSARGALLFGATFTLIEILRMKFPFGGFGWGRIGHAGVNIISPLYPYLGIAGITFLVTLIAALLNLRFRRFIFALPIFAIVFILPNADKTGEVDVTAVQGGVDKLGLDYNERALGVLRRHVQATLTSSSDPDLWIWPENASDIDPLNDSRAKSLIEEVTRSKKKPLLVGAVLRSTDGPKNVSILYDEKGEVSSLYVKQDLAPFGEYMPLRSIAQRVAPEAKRVRDFKPGSQWVIHKISGQSFLSVICFEVLDDDFITSVAREANFLVTQTNNATFGRSSQAAQQLQIIRARAAQLHRDFAVVSTTGFTAHIDATGKILKELPQFEAGALEMKIAAYEDETWAMRINSWIWALVFLVSLAVSRRSVFSR